MLSITLQPIYSMTTEDRESAEQIERERDFKRAKEKKCGKNKTRGGTQKEGYSLQRGTVPET